MQDKLVRLRCRGRKQWHLDEEESLKGALVRQNECWRVNNITWYYQNWAEHATPKNIAIMPT